MKKRTTLTAVLAVAVALAGCAGGDGSDNSAAAVSEGTSASAADESTSASDTTDSSSSATTSASTETATTENAASHAESADFEYPDGNVIEITLGQDVDSSDVTVSGGTVTTTGAGAYELTGTLVDGRVVVEAGGHDLVQLILNGAQSGGTLIHIESGSGESVLTFEPA